MAQGLRILLFGASGMVGQCALRECLRSDEVSAVACVVRSPLPAHPKLTQIIHPDLLALDPIAPALQGFDACLYCLGSSSAGQAPALYESINHDMPLAAARALAPSAAGMCFLYLSGAGTDSSESGPQLWARIKGRTENALLRAGFKGAYMLRLGAVVPLHGERSRTFVYQAFYVLSRPLHGWLLRRFPERVIGSENLGRAMIRLAHGKRASGPVEAAELSELGR
ncbi:epimerase [Niveibacterium sp. SC-1]|uniref:epimerase n=1 Tax=Niveibacterium sp. SC-1 TaxID=3135646 RepID=UPI00311D63A3